MDELHRASDKFFEEAALLERMLDLGGRGPEHLDIMVSQAKRVRRNSNLLVRALAAHRDHLHRTADKEN